MNNKDYRAWYEDELNEKIKQLEEENKMLKGELERIKKELEGAKKSGEEFAYKRANSNAENKKLKDERDFFKEQAILWRKDYKNEYEKNKKLKERIKELETDYDRLKVAFEDVVSGK